METIGLTFARAHLSDLIDRAEAGGSIVITRRGKPVARVSSVMPTRRPIDPAMLRSLSATMPLQSENAADLVRAMRDGARY